MRFIFFSILFGVSSIFSSDFFWGVSISEYQNSGSDVVDNCNWSKWEEENSVDSGSSNNHFKDYNTHIDAAEELGCNSFRFSLEWSLIEKEEGVFDQAVLDRYHAEIDELIKRGITPMVTMHHFTEPLWFTEKGGFENQANVKLFEEFAIRIFKEFHGKVKFWAVINEPAVCALMPYLLGKWPPGKVDVKAGFSVLKNLLIAHVNVYQHCKKIDKSAQIGFVHSFLEFSPYSSWNPIERVVSYYMTKMWNEGVTNFFLTGELNLDLPFKGKMEYKDNLAVDTYDFVGVNYYSTPILKFTPFGEEWMEASCYDDHIMTDMPYHSNPKGFYDTLMRCRAFNKPIYVTENGIADAIDDRRGQFIGDYVAAMHRAMEDGADVRGYYYWTLFDNFEWSDAFEMKFGLFHFDRDTHDYLIKDGGKVYRDIVKENRVSSKVSSINADRGPVACAKIFKKVSGEEKKMIVADDSLVLYLRWNCPYCKKVKRFLNNNNIQITIKDANVPKNYHYLNDNAGRNRVPCLFIDGEPMFESDDIIRYLRELLLTDAE